MLDMILNVHVILGLNASLGTFTCNVSAVLALQMLSWDSLAYTTPIITKMATTTKTDTPTLTETAVMQSVTAAQTAASYAIQTKEEKPYVDPISHVVLCLGIIADLAGALVAARRK
jgi:Membrane-anchored protein predicted to be involved in regulation of amylopullulanase